MKKNVKIMPSLLAGDFGNLEASARKAEESGADEIHLDIMDAHFVRNLSMGPDVVKMAARCLTIPINVHLMLTRPDYYLETFAEAGADTLTIHVESQCDLPASLARIKELGMRPGISINPETSASNLTSYLDMVDEI
ncbi:MAG: ribulose-phosphate 3-epimerase, partial [Lentisphaerae bacterium]|nr:ribulose-phosphate 3-epimerase [Lentisphaerota bacterium]